MLKEESEIIKIIEKMSGRYPPYTIFTDWICMMALSIQNSCQIIHDKVWNDREQQYLKRVAQYSKEEMQQFVKMSALLTEIFEQEMSDVLGDIYMRSGSGNKNTGQFFTPFHLSEAVAKLMVQNISEENPFIMNEPSVGGGGMVIAAAKALREKGINPQRCMKVVAQDLDWNAIYMCYVQLSLIGIDAVVAQGNTLMMNGISQYPRECIFRTPKNMGVLL